MVSRRVARTEPRTSKYAIRNWTLYVVRLSDRSYYIGITSYSDFMHRIRQHGGRAGARWARAKTVQEIIELHPLGKLTRLQAENIENDYTIEYRKQYGYRKVRGGYNALVHGSFVPNYTPGSRQSLVFLTLALSIATVAIIFITIQSR
jgi:predicted GIY-YIG superfamily endonuclease